MIKMTVVTIDDDFILIISQSIDFISSSCLSSKRKNYKITSLLIDSQIAVLFQFNSSYLFNIFLWKNRLLFSY